MGFKGYPTRRFRDTTGRHSDFRTGPVRFPSRAPPRRTGGGGGPPEYTPEWANGPGTRMPAPYWANGPWATPNQLASAIVRLSPWGRYMDLLKMGLEVVNMLKGPGAESVTATGNYDYFFHCIRCGGPVEYRSPKYNGGSGDVNGCPGPLVCTTNQVHAGTIQDGDTIDLSTTGLSFIPKNCRIFLGPSNLGGLRMQFDQVIMAGIGANKGNLVGTATYHGPKPAILPMVIPAVHPVIDPSTLPILQPALYPAPLPLVAVRLRVSAGISEGTHVGNSTPEPSPDPATNPPSPPPIVPPVSVSPGSGAPPNPTPRPVPGRPPKGTRELKLGTSRPRAVTLAIINAITEGADLINALWYALPTANRTPGRPSITQKWSDVYSGLGDINYYDAAGNIINNEIADHIGGRIGRANRAASRRAAGYTGNQIPRGFQSGPAL